MRNYYETRCMLKKCTAYAGLGRPYNKRVLHFVENVSFDGNTLAELLGYVAKHFKIKKDEILFTDSPCQIKVIVLENAEFERASKKEIRKAEKHEALVWESEYTITIRKTTVEYINVKEHLEKENNQ